MPVRKIRLLEYFGTLFVDRFDDDDAGRVAVRVRRNEGM
jgi:hypothetical protein